MAWRCVAKKADGTKCKCVVATRGGRCQHHKGKRKNPKSKKARKKKRVRCRPSRATQCAATTYCSKRCKQYAAGRSKYCRVHKGKPRTAPYKKLKRLKKKTRRRKKKNPIAPFMDLQDRWSLPRMPKGVLK